MEARISPVLPWIVGVTLFMQSIDGSVLNNALPSMAAALNVNPLQMQAVIVAYLLTAALFIPLSGWLADRFGVRRVFCLAIIIFSFGSLCCALSPSLYFLVVSRVIQGLGGALMVPVGRLAVVKIYSHSAELVRVLGFISIPAILGPVCGPLAGGFFVQYASWHWIFLINIPVGLLALWLSLKYVPQLKEKGGPSFDFLGFTVFGSSVAALSLWLVLAPDTGWLDNLGLLALGLLLMFYFWYSPAKKPGAIFNRAIFKKPGYLVGILGNICSRTGSGAIPFMLPMFLQLGLGFNPIKAGLFMLPQAVGSFFGKRLITVFLPKAGFKGFLQANTVSLGVMVCLFSYLSVSTPEAVMIFVFLVFGTVNSMQFTAMNSFLLIDLESWEAATANSLLSVIIQICNNSGVALGAALLSIFALAEHGGAFTAEHLSGPIFEKAFFCIGLVILAASLVMSRIPKNVSKIKGNDVRQYQEH
ncbi:MAG: MFS transporter [Deltaproteobacteria bacterium]|nr:MFS transporter [Deltaproteobacteria bacterium]